MRALRGRSLRPWLPAGAMIGMGGAFALAYAGAAKPPDIRALLAFQNLQRQGWLDREYTLIHTVNPVHFAVAAILLPGIAAARRQPRVALAMLLELAGSAGSAEALKHLLSIPAGPSPAAPASNAFPSGHAAAAMALVLAAEIGAPAALRPAIAALGVVYLLALGYTLIALGNHYPSEVVAGLLLSGMWGVIGMAAAGGTKRARRSAWASAVQPGALAKVVAAFAALVVITVLIVQALRPARSLAETPLLVIFAMTAAALLMPWVVSRLEPRGERPLRRHHGPSLP